MLGWQTENMSPNFLSVRDHQSLEIEPAGPELFDPPVDLFT
jgi:hypothetical protein